MKILISGGTGLVGCELGKALVSKGHELYILTRSKEKATLNCPFPQTPITYSELAEHPILPELHCIINLAGTNLMDQRWNKKFKELIRNSRIQTTELLTKIAKSKCPKLQSFISTSAIGIYGETGEHSAHENSKYSNDFLGQLCQDWERPVKELTSCRTVIIRTGIVFSEKSGALQEMSRPVQIGIGGALSSGKQFMSWIDIDDLINIYCFALESNITGPYNAVAPHPETNEKITKAIGSHLNKHSFFRVPRIALQATLGEMARYIIANQKICSKKIQDAGYQFLHKNVMSSIDARVPRLSGLQKQLVFEQWIPEKKENVFPFFSDPNNLKKITPEQLQFQVTHCSTEKIQQGTLIDYKLKVDGIPMKWRTLITECRPPHFFSDNQEKGPYTKWFHEHHFTDLANGTLMIDKVTFEIPLGPLGHAATSWKVLKHLKSIFDFRRTTIHNLFQ